MATAIGVKQLQTLTTDEDMEIEVGDVIGKGAYGKVYSGRMTESEGSSPRQVAVKQVVYNPKSTNGIPLAALRELAASFHVRRTNNNIINLIDWVETPSSNPKEVILSFVYDLMTCDLTKFLKARESKLPLDLIQKWSRQILSGLDELHASRLVHRDLKPDNMLINMKTMDIKIGDLGLAHAYGFEGSRTPEIVTLWYRAPDIILRMRQYGSMCDMWSAGLVIAEMVALKPLVKGNSELDTMRDILRLIGEPDERAQRVRHMDWSCFVPDKYLPLVNHVEDVLAGEDEFLIDLIKNILQFLSEDRPTARMTLQHPFFDQEYPITNHAVFAEGPPTVQSTSEDKSSDSNGMEDEETSENDDAVPSDMHFDVEIVEVETSDPDTGSGSIMSRDSCIESQCGTANETSFPASNENRCPDPTALEACSLAADKCCELTEVENQLHAFERRRYRRQTIIGGMSGHVLHDHGYASPLPAIREAGECRCTTWITCSSHLNGPSAQGENIPVRMPGPRATSVGFIRQAEQLRIDQCVWEFSSANPNAANPWRGTDRDRRRSLPAPAWRTMKPPDPDSN